MDFDTWRDGDTAWRGMVFECCFILIGATVFAFPESGSIECLYWGEFEQSAEAFWAT